MSLDDNKLLVRNFYEKIVNTGKVDEIDKYIGPSYTEVIEGQKYVVGLEGAKEHISGVRKTYPDLMITIEQQMAEGEWVVSCIITKGTHKGYWLGIKPTGKLLTFTGVNVDRVANGRIIEHGGAANMLGPLLEIGAIKAV